MPQESKEMKRQIIKKEIEKALMKDVDIPENIGMTVVKKVMRNNREKQQEKDPLPLWLSLWYEGEVCCLFADSNVGKSIYAVQIANEIAKKEIVIYFDFELSGKQFQMRYTDEKGNLYPLQDNLYRAEFNPESLDDTDFDEALMKTIEDCYKQTHAKVMVIDNLSFLCNESEKGDAAGTLMRNLTALKKKYGLSLLVIAHTKKRIESNPITANDLNGSKRLFNFFDSAFTIGKSAKGENLRYIKQLKARYGGFEYGSRNVIVSRIEKTNGFLHFENTGCGFENDHLRELSREDIIREAKDLRLQGKTQREIADIVGKSTSWVNSKIKS